MGLNEIVFGGIIAIFTLLLTNVLTWITRFTELQYKANEDKLKHENELRKVLFDKKLLVAEQAAKYISLIISFQSTIIHYITLGLGENDYLNKNAFDETVQGIQKVHSDFNQKKELLPDSIRSVNIYIDFLSYQDKDIPLTLRWNETTNNTLKFFYSYKSLLTQYYTLNSQQELKPNILEKFNELKDSLKLLSTISLEIRSLHKDMEKVLRNNVNNI